MNSIYVNQFFECMITNAFWIEIDTEKGLTVSLFVDMEQLNTALRYSSTDIFTDNLLTRYSNIPS